MSQADDPLLTAIDWKLRLSSGEAGHTERQAFEQWLASRPEHRQAWQRLEQPFQGLPPLARGPRLRRLLDDGQLLSAERRRLLGGGLGLLVLASGGWWSMRATPDNLSTALGQRRDLTLADGSRLSLNAASEVELAFDANQRRLRLRQGELIVQVAGDPRRPFIVQTRHGEIRALGTRFLVRQQRQRTLVLMLEHQTRLSLPDGRQATLEEGDAAYLWRDGIQPLGSGQRHQAAWAQGRLELRDQPLGDAIEALDAYLPGLLRVSPEAARLPVFGTFALDSPQRILESLEQTLPLKIHRYGPVTLIEKIE